MEGPLPFKYLGVPLACKKLSIHHYMILVDKIVGRVQHQSTKLLSYAGRVQLINSISFVITNYWMQCFPLPKSLIKKADVVCRSFLWTGGDDIGRKNPIACKNICKPRKQGGLNVIEQETYNKIAMMKLLWNLSGKSDNLWVKLVYTYYFKNNSMMKVNIRPNNTWIMKVILQQRENITQVQNLWDQMLNKSKFHMKTMYANLRDDEQDVARRTLLYNNVT